MDHLAKFRHLVGIRSNLAEQLNEFAQLQDLFSVAIPPAVRDFLTSLSDCVLYYRFEAPTRAGKTKAYSHFVMTNIGPELASYYPFPASLIGMVVRFREGGLQDGCLPLMFDFGKTNWLWCNLSQGGAVIFPRGGGMYGCVDKDWNVLAPTFDSFIEGLQLDLSPLLKTFRLVGTGNVQPNMRDWFKATVGEDWESEVHRLIQPKRRK